MKFFTNYNCNLLIRQTIKCKYLFFIEVTFGTIKNWYFNG